MNNVYRSLDIFNYPSGVSIIKQLQSIKTIYNVLSINPSTIPKNMIITKELVRQRLETIVPITDQEIAEYLDVSLFLEIPAEEILQRARQGRVLEPRPVVARRNIRSIKNIHETTLSEISKDSQNVHSTAINNSFLELCKKLVSTYNKNIIYSIKSRDIILDLQKHKYWLDTNTISINFIERNLTCFDGEFVLADIFRCVYYRITTHLKKHKDDLFPIFNQELDHMRGLCTTGHLSRLMNILQGFDPDFQLNLDFEKELKIKLKNIFNLYLRKAPEEIQEELTEPTEKIINFLTEFINSEEFISKFEKEYYKTQYSTIKEYIKEYLRINQ